jgi:hypothetical protein
MEEIVIGTVGRGFSLTSEVNLVQRLCHAVAIENLRHDRDNSISSSSGVG